jgi:hypothetical protein
MSSSAVANCVEVVHADRATVRNNNNNNKSASASTALLLSSPASTNHQQNEFAFSPSGSDAPPLFVKMVFICGVVMPTEPKQKIDRYAIDC